jgi:hypothetical protein
MRSDQVRVTTNLSRQEYFAMKNAGYKWNQLIRAGFFSLNTESPLVTRMNQLEREVKGQAATISRINERTRIQITDFIKSKEE